MNIQTKKSDIIKRIERISDEMWLSKIDLFLESIEEKSSSKIYTYHKAPSPSTDLQELIQEQQYNSQNLKGMGGILADKDEPLEELLRLV